MELQGQVAIITGAGRGIGRATALELARMAADIVVAELNRENAERTASEVRGLGRLALVVPTDVTSRIDHAAMVERTRAAFGRIDALVNNAGIYRQEPRRCPRWRRDQGELRMPRLCRDGHVDLRSSRAERAAQPIA